MDKDVIIRVEGLGKRYTLGAASDGRYVALRDVLAQGARRLIRRTRRVDGGSPPPAAGTDFWALREVNFEVRRGEVVGIIGRNGAGKSTLLKILSRITEPTQGRVTLKGRVASLLEVGTGFHPELTGRENIYLNGAILGMHRAEIKAKFDEIVAFADVERFLDTPVKRYSSGMYVRLAFAVAAHLEPEILVVDEVLAVGDIGFQKKCLGKMSEVARGGRTVLFVSHNIDAIRRLCGTGVLLTQGRVETIGPIDKVIESYLAQSQEGVTGSVIHYPSVSKDRFHVERIEILDPDGSLKDTVRTWERVCFRIFFHAPRALKSGSVVLQITTPTEVVLTLASTQPDQLFPMDFVAGANVVDCVIERLMLAAGVYHVGAALAVPNVEMLSDGLNVGRLEVESADVFGSGQAPQSTRYLVPMDCRWKSFSPRVDSPMRGVDETSPGN